jgi:hypothetical protein
VPRLAQVDNRQKTFLDFFLGRLMVCASEFFFWLKQASKIGLPPWARLLEDLG